ncbi:L,D-transpeptidase-like protein [Actinomycetospora succinea]|uniref:L,D-transpeptidase-like protein n=1 Tax=Actinomycetospora succinea TaxID=663603 RepID=A0A4R6VIG1_9PSEU|nr:L,D-transpeptidase-like protein [Actinomycetospora succinea]
MAGRHRRGAQRGVSSGRIAVSVATIGLGALQLGGVALAAPAGSADGVGGTPCTDARIKACVDLSENRAWLLDGDGNVTYGPVKNSHGAEGYETPTGDFVIQRKEKDHVSQEYEGSPMPYAVFFDNNGRAFHGGATDRESAGCVRLGKEDAKRFFEHLNPNDRVQIVE